MKKILIVVDMQNDFITGALGTKEAAAVLLAVRAEIGRRQKEGWEIVYTRDTHARNYLQTQEGRNLPVEHCIGGTEGWEIAEGVYAGGKIFDKPAFGSKELAAYVAAGGYEEAELIGVCTDICVISNALLIKAFAPETKVCVLASACAGATPAGHENALAALRVCQVEVL